MSHSIPHPDELRPEAIWNYLRETAEILRRLGEETDRRFQETDRKIQESFRMSKETDRQMQETDRKIKQLSEQIGRLGNRLGEFVEEQVMPSALRLMQERGIEVHEIYSRAKAKRHGRSAEIDLLLVNSTDVVAVEVKSALGVPYVEQHVARLKGFKGLFPHYAGFRLYGAVAGMVVLDDAIARADEEGLFVLVPAAGTMQLGNGAEFRPRTW